MSTQRSFLRILAYGAAALVAVPVIVLAAMFFWPDQSLSPRAEELRSLPARVPAEQNGALYALGITAQADPYAAGLAYQAAHNAAIEARLANPNTTATVPAISSVLGSLILPGNMLDKNVCSLVDSPCLKAYQASAIQIGLLQTEHASLLQRYEQLKTYAYFQQPLTMVFESPIEFKALTQAARFALMRTALDMQAPATQERGLTRLAQEAKYWRSVLAQSESLVEKMIAASLVTQQARLASEIISTYPLAANTYAAQISAATQALSAAQLSMQWPMHSEFAMLSRLLMNPQALLQPQAPLLTSLNATRLVYKPQTTVNRVSSYFDTVLQTQSLPAKELLERQAQRTQANSFSWFSPRTLINPIGEILVSTATPNFSDYSLRMHDLDALLRLTEVQRQIVLKSVPPTEVAAFVAQLGPALHDPYTQAPLSWKADTQTLSVQAHSSKAKDRPVYEVRVAR